MSDSMRWRYGDTNPVVMPVASDTVIEIGDLLYFTSGAAKPASAQANTGTKDDKQINFHNKFAGVAMQRSPAGNSNPIRVACTGVFEYACLAATFAVGDIIGVDESSPGGPLANQVVIKVGSFDHSIGRCVKTASTNTTKVLVDIASVVIKGGPVVPA